MNELKAEQIQKCLADNDIISNVKINASEIQIRYYRYITNGQHFWLQGFVSALQIQGFQVNTSESE